MKYIIATLLFCFSLSVFSEECSEKKECWPEGSAMRTGMEFSEKLIAFDDRLTKDHKEMLVLLKQLKAKDYLIDLLREQQNAWQVFHEKDCQLAGTLTGAGGSWPSTWGLSCDVDTTSKRLGHVQLAIMCLNKIDKKDLNIDSIKYDCLNRLTINTIKF